LFQRNTQKAGVGQIPHFWCTLSDLTADSLYHITSRSCKHPKASRYVALHWPLLLYRFRTTKYSTMDNFRNAEGTLTRIRLKGLTEVTHSTDQHISDTLPVLTLGFRHRLPTIIGADTCAENTYPS